MIVTVPSSSPNARAAGRVVDLVDVLHLGEVVARAQRAELIGAARESVVRHLRRVGSLEAAVLLERLEVARLAEPALDRPRRAPPQHGAEVVAAEMLVRAPAAHAGRDVAVERLDHRNQRVPQIGAAEVGAQQPDAAVDVVADAAGRDHAFVGVDAGDAADGKP